MQPVICYVYEYDRDQRIRNAGFLKIQPKDSGVLLYFHIHSPLFRAQSSWNIYAFRSDGVSCTLYPVLTVPVESQNFRMQFSLDSLRLTGELTLDDMDGFWMSSPQSTILAAAWKPTFVNSEHFSIYNPPDCNLSESDVPLEESSIENPDEKPIPKVPEASSEKSAEAPSEKALAELSDAPSEPPLNKTPEDGAEIKPVESAEIMEPPETPVQAQTPSTKVRKICRKELTLLPRRDWSLSNNSFLLHGCHNYHHLILVEEGAQLFLGVPGIYDPREARAAELFGFPVFSSEYVPLLELMPEEKSDAASFGHYLRKIRRN